MAKKLAKIKKDDFVAGIDAYIASCQPSPLVLEDGSVVLDKQGQPVMMGGRVPSLPGAALWLGYSSKQSLYNRAAGAQECQDALDKLLLYIEDYAVQRLYTRDGARGAIFCLGVNFGWREQCQQSQRDEDESVCGVIEIPAVVEVVPPEELEEVAQDEQ